nr:pickpocket protein 28-like [Leptinotarsa decemlineata]
MMSTSREVENYRPSIRQCYFADERSLKYFNIYTPDNCRLECLTNYTLNMCGCVNFYMPRNHSTAICGNGKVECMDDALYKMKEKEVEIMLGESSNSNSACNCMPLCSELTYNTETARTQFYWREMFQAEKMVAETMKEIGVNVSDVHLSRLSVYFMRDQFLKYKRTELYGPFDFLANFGGLLGLFTGFSVLSAVEIIYYLCVRWYCNKRLYDDFAGM